MYTHISRGRSGPRGPPAQDTWVPTTRAATPDAVQRGAGWANGATSKCLALNRPFAPIGLPWFRASPGGRNEGAQWSSWGAARWRKELRDANPLGPNGLRVRNRSPAMRVLIDPRPPEHDDSDRALQTVARLFQEMAKF